MRQTTGKIRIKAAERKAERYLNRQIALGFDREESVFCTSIMYPEFLRSGFLRNLAEMLLALGSAVFTGSHDFSVGDIQMRPSSAMEIENYVSSAGLKADYSRICPQEARSAESSRRSMLRRTLRLADRDCVILYMKGFVALYRDRCVKSGRMNPTADLFREEQLLRRFEIAYSCGTDIEEQIIQEQLEVNNFPSGTRHKRSYDNYSRIAAQWWRKNRGPDAG